MMTLIKNTTCTSEYKNVLLYKDIYIKVCPSLITEFKKWDITKYLKFHSLPLKKFFAWSTFRWSIHWNNNFLDFNMNSSILKVLYNTRNFCTGYILDLFGQIMYVDWSIHMGLNIHCNIIYYLKYYNLLMYPTAHKDYF